MSRYDARDDVFDDLMDRVTPESPYQVAVTRRDPGLRCFVHETQRTVLVQHTDAGEFAWLLGGGVLCLLLRWSKGRLV